MNEELQAQDGKLQEQAQETQTLEEDNKAKEEQIYILH